MRLRDMLYVVDCVVLCVALCCELHVPSMFRSYITFLI